MIYEITFVLRYIVLSLLQLLKNSEKCNLEVELGVQCTSVICAIHFIEICILYVLDRSQRLIHLAARGYMPHEMVYICLTKWLASQNGLQLRMFIYLKLILYLKLGGFVVTIFLVRLFLVNKYF